MRKTICATIAVSIILLSSIVEMQAVEVANANFGPSQYTTPYESPPIIAVGSPLNQTYRKSSINLSFNVTEPSDWLKRSQITWGPYFTGDYQTSLVMVSYTIDNNNVTVFDNSEVFINGTSRATTYKEFSFALSGLSEGSHTIDISASGRGYFIYDGSGLENLGPIRNSSSTINFIINTSPSCIPILFLENKTYIQNQIPLTFSINETASKIAYSLDNQVNNTITGNVTLTGLSEGSHSITVYAKDSNGNIGKSDTVFFTVNTATPSPSPSPTQQPTTEHSPTPSSVETEKADHSGLGSDTMLIAVGLLVVAVIVSVAVVLRIRK